LLLRAEGRQSRMKNAEPWGEDGGAQKTRRRRSKM
jgi:hypothetical protein